jgi:outer membrane immunogenic protein
MRRIAIAAVVGSAFLGGIAAAHAADMRVKAPPMVAPLPAFSWTGFYVGANVGGAWTPGSDGSAFQDIFPPFIVLPPIVPIITLVPGGLASLTGSGGQSAVIGGGQIGYNWQVQQFVLGVEADVVGTGLKGATASATRDLGLGATQTVTVDTGRIDWMASFRGRAGFAADRALFYVTGGAAVAEIGGASATLVNGPAIAIPAGTFTSTTGGSSTRWGWTVGGGIEWAFNQNWSLAGEYRHTDFGSRGTTVNIPDGLGGTFAPVTVNGRLTVDQATARLNYRFGGPVVARY